MTKRYKSGFEKTLAKYFRKNGIRFKYEPTVVSFIQPEKKRKYKPDFGIQTKKRGMLFVEAKGKLTLADRQKLVWVRDQNPDLRIVLVFMNADVKLRKGSQTTYGEWATKTNFEWYDFRKGLPKWT